MSTRSHVVTLAFPSALFFGWMGCGSDSKTPSSTDAGLVSVDAEAEHDASNGVPKCESRLASFPGAELRVEALLNGMTGGFALDVSADGSFVGFVPITHERCEGQLTTTELDDIVTAFDDNGWLCRDDITECPGVQADNLYLDIEWTFGGAVAPHQVCVVFCELLDGPNPLGSISGALLTPIFRVREAGECTESDYFPPNETASCAALP